MDLCSSAAVGDGRSRPWISTVSTWRTRLPSVNSTESVVATSLNSS